MRIRAILFDADGVIQGPTSDLHTQVSEVFGITLDQVEEFLHKIVSPAERRALTGKRDFPKELAAELAKWNRTVPDPVPLAVFTSIAAFADVEELIRSLRSSGTLCYLASNQAPFRARYLSDVLGYRDIFDRQFYSCDLGYAKPDPEYFRTILRKIELTPSQGLLLDDHEENVAAALEVGLHASLFVAKNHANRRKSLIELFSRYGLHLT